MITNQKNQLAPRPAPNTKNKPPELAEKDYY